MQCTTSCCRTTAVWHNTRFASVILFIGHYIRLCHKICLNLVEQMPRFLNITFSEASRHLRLLLLGLSYLQVTWLVVTEVQRESFELVTETKTDVTCCDAFSSSSSGIIFIPSATCVTNFVSFAVSVAELAHGEKSRNQSLNHSLTHPAYLMPREPKLWLRNFFCGYDPLTR